jgi:hypothetical protein
MCGTPRLFYEVVGCPHIDLAANKLVLSVDAASRAGSHRIPLSAPPAATGKACGQHCR